MVKTYKKEKVAELKKYFDEYPNYIFINFFGLPVEKISTLRRELRKLDAKMVVMKNSYIDIIAKDKSYPSLDTFTKGGTAVIFARDNSNEVAKLLYSVNRDIPITVKGALVENSLLDNKGTEDFSKLPTKKEMLAIVMATMNAPIQNFVFACNDVVARFVRVVKDYATKKEGA
jgi:large subunit ribosomal protein L10